MQSNRYKIIWDLWVLILLVVISLIVPIRLAFAESDPLGWFIFYIATDVMFIIDIILTFFTSVSDEKKVYEIVNKREIASRYLRGWFWIDLISVLPMDIIFRTQQQ